MLDCPPALGMASWAALAAADSVLIPVQCEDYGAQGLPLVFKAIEAAKLALNPRIGVLGLLLTMYAARRSLHQMYGDLLRQQYGDLVLSVVVPEAAEVPESIMLRKPVCHHKPRGAASRAFAALAEEVETRLALRAATEQGEAA
jgi:chromosome partitioning protein